LIALSRKKWIYTMGTYEHAHTGSVCGRSLRCDSSPSSKFSYTYSILLTQFFL